MSIRWKAVLITVAALGLAHFMAGPAISKIFNAGIAAYVQPPLETGSVSLDFLNAQASAKDIRMASWRENYPAFLDIRQLLLRWETLPLLSKRMVLEEISAAGVQLVLPWDDMQPAWSHMRMTWPAKTATGDAVLRVTPLKPAIVVREVYVTDLSLRLASDTPQRPPLPALTNATLRLRHAEAWFEASEKPVEFLFEGRLEGQERSYVRTEANLSRDRDAQWTGEGQIVLEGLDLAKLWPWINPAWLPEEFLQFQVIEGFLNLRSRFSLRHGRWTLRHQLTLKQLKIRLNPGSPYRKLRRASPELVVEAVNSLGDASLEFGNYAQWKAAFEENVMKGVRNLIRRSLAESLQNLFGPAGT